MYAKREQAPVLQSALFFGNFKTIPNKGVSRYLCGIVLSKAPKNFSAPLRGLKNLQIAVGNFGGDSAGGGFPAVAIFFKLHKLN